MKQSTKQEKNPAKNETEIQRPTIIYKHEAVGIKKNKKRHYVSEQETSRQDKQVQYAIIRFLTRKHQKMIRPVRNTKDISRDRQRVNAWNERLLPN